MKRRLLNLAVITSTMLLIALLIYWPISHHYMARFAKRPVEVSIGTGQVVVEWSSSWVSDGTPLFKLDVIDEASDRWDGLAFSELQWTFADVTFYRIIDITSALSSTSPPPGSPRIRFDGWMLIVPIWMAALLLLILPVLWLFWFRHSSQRNRRKRGLCIVCGYDLRGAATESATCPECGKSGVSASR